ncbi:MAG: HAD-IA family hydrolase [Chloroflexi bacterium]|nr:HAD-IA family hydrolase [Chloroflexota bacterium]
MTTSHPAAVFFDAYGTLIHFPDDPSPFDYMADVLQRERVDLPRPHLDDALHAEMRYYKAHYASVRTADDLERLRIEDARVYLEALGDTGAVPLDLNLVADELAAAFESRVLPDAHAAIDLVRTSGVRTAVLSNFSYLLPLVLDEVGLGDGLDPIVFSAAVGAEKPDPRIFAAAAAAVDADLGDCVLIGDDFKNDVGGAQRCGMPVVWLARDGSDAPPGVAVARNLVDAVHLALGPGWRELSLSGHTPPSANA